MTTVEAASGAADDPASTAGATERVRSDRLPVILLVGLYLLSVAIYVLLGRGQPVPQVSPDEFTYSTLARSLADGQGLTWNGASQNLTAALWVYVISPAWWVTDSTVTSYALAKGIAAVTSSLVVFPVWLLARRYVGPFVALVAATLAVAGSWMTHAGQLLTENLAYPLSAAALAALVTALLRPGSRWGWIALGFIALATWSRLQMGVLVPIAFLVLVIDVAACGRQGWRARVRANAWLLGVTGVLTAASAAIALGSPSSLGFYSTVVQDTSLGRVPGFVGKQLLAFIAMSGILPFIIAAAVSARRDVWRDRAMRALLIVCWTTIVVFILQTGYTLPRLGGVTWSIQRYVEYGLPLLFVLAVAGIWNGLLEVRRVAITTVVVAVGLYFTQDIRNIVEERSSFGFARAADVLLGTTPGWGLAIAAILSGGAVVVTLLAAKTSPSPKSLLIVSMLAVAVVFGIQNQATWHWQREQAQVGREALPKDLQWVDHAADAPVARLLGVFNSVANSEQTEFFNRNIQQIYTTPDRPIAGKPVRGKSCRWSANAAGVPTFGPECGPQPTRFLLSDEIMKPTFYDQDVLATGLENRVVSVNAKPPARPRLKAVVFAPCTAPFKTENQRTGEIYPANPLCFGPAGVQSTAQLFLDAPGRIALTFKGGTTKQLVRITTSASAIPKTVEIPPGKTTVVKLDFPSGAQAYQADFGWPTGAQNPANPVLKSVTLTQNGKSEELLY